MYAFINIEKKILLHFSYTEFSYLCKSSNVSCNIDFILYYIAIIIIIIIIKIEKGRTTLEIFHSVLIYFIPF